MIYEDLTNYATVCYDAHSGFLLHILPPMAVSLFLFSCSFHEPFSEDEAAVLVLLQAVYVRQSYRGQ